jgi:DNA-directed RNA polymerase II subunit RPB2
MGVLASIIPFSDHNQSPRNTYQSAMGKQAMGIYLTSFQQRMDSLAYILCYPQKSIVNSRLIHSLPSNNLPSGLNAIVAIACYSGYNQEDSVIFNQSAVDRGLFTSTFYRTYRDDEKKSQLTGDEEKFCIPSHSTTIGMRGSNYSLLTKDGYVAKDTFVRENDVIIGKVSPMRDDKGTLYYKDNSVTIRNNEHGCVDKVAIARNGEGYRFLKMRVRSHRKPTIGDKHCIPMDSFVLTSNGWKTLESVNIESD